MPPLIEVASPRPKPCQQRRQRWIAQVDFEGRLVPGSEFIDIEISQSDDCSGHRQLYSRHSSRRPGSDQTNDAAG